MLLVFSPNLYRYNEYRMSQKYNLLIVTFIYTLTKALYKTLAVIHLNNK